MTFPVVLAICHRLHQDRNKFLLIQRAFHDSHGGMWCFPGGSRDDLSLSADTEALRELKEETGFVGLTTKLLIENHLYSNKDNPERTLLVTCIQVELEEQLPVPTLCSDIQGIGWFSWVDLEGLNLAPLMISLTDELRVELSMEHNVTF